MSDDERVLRSFVGEDEELQDLWTVTKAKRSKGQLPPAGGEETVAVTDRRLLWFANELEAVALDDVVETELEYVERQAAPPMVLGGGLLFVLGIFASIGAFFANVGDIFVVTLPAMTGLAVFLGSRIVASATGREGETRAGHRLRLWADSDTVSIWGDDEATMAALASAVRGEDDSTAAVGEGDATDDETDDWSTPPDDSDSAGTGDRTADDETAG